MDHKLFESDTLPSYRGVPFEEPQPCKCGFKTDNKLDDMHIYCLKCGDTVHLGHEYPKYRSGACKTCGRVFEVSKAEDGWVRVHDFRGNFLYGLDGE